MAFGTYRKRQKKSRPGPEGIQSDEVKIDNPDYKASVAKLQEEISRIGLKRTAAEDLSTTYEILEEQRGAELRFSLEKRIPTVRECGTFLEWRVSPDRLKLARANFCKDRLCPMCNWRRSLKMYAQISKIMNVLENEEYRYLFLTLTVRNCPGDELSETISMMFSGWREMYHHNQCFRRDKQVIEGTIRILEITYNPKEKTFHPHFHVILAVKPEYFAGRRYIKTAEWVKMWRRACGLNYDPLCWIEKIKPILKEGERGGMKGAVAEVSKYPFKDTDWKNQHGTERQDVLIALLNGLRGRRLVGFTGCFGQVRRQLKLDDVEEGDLANVEDLRDDVRDVVVRCYWRSGFDFWTEEGGIGYQVRVVTKEELEAEEEWIQGRKWDVDFDNQTPAIPEGSCGRVYGKNNEEVARTWARSQLGIWQNAQEGECDS